MRGWVAVIGFVETERVAEPEAIVADGTIGITYDRLEEHAVVDLGRLERALIAYREEIGADDVSVTVLDGPESGARHLALFDPAHSQDVQQEMIVLAGRVRGDEDGDQA